MVHRFLVVSMHYILFSMLSSTLYSILRVFASPKIVMGETEGIRREEGGVRGRFYSETEFLPLEILPRPEGTGLETRLVGKLHVSLKLPCYEIPRSELYLSPL